MLATAAEIPAAAGQMIATAAEIPAAAAGWIFATAAEIPAAAAAAAEIPATAAGLAAPGAEVDRQDPAEKPPRAGLDAAELGPRLYCFR